VERLRLDRKVRDAEREVERLARERAEALEQVDDLQAMHAAAEAEILRVGDQFMTVEEQKRRHEAKLTDLQDKFIQDLMQGHEQELSTLAFQHDEAQARLQVLAGQVAAAKRDAELAASSLDAQRADAARLVKERES